jgi:membrane associated rhomboid family serine protease
VDTAIRSATSRSQAEEWALVLAAFGIPHRVESFAGGWAVIVPEEDAARAREALEPGDDDALAHGPVLAGEPAERPTPWLLGSAACLALLAFFALTGPPGAGDAWFERGAATAGQMAGEPWRAVTALTLHLDAAHAAGNALAIAIVLPAVGQRFGAGVGLLLTVLAGACGNLLAALVHAPEHSAAGASTAIFAAFGILGTSRFFRSGDGRGRRLRPWVVAAASIALLAMLGTGPKSDVIAHGTGFVSGGVLGVIAAAALPPPSPAIQWLAGALTPLVVIACWRLAF